MHMHPWLRSLLLLSTVWIALAGCASTPPLVVDGFTLNPDPWFQDRQKLLQRASFDLSCDPANLTLRVLAVGGNGIFFDDWATQVGVAGCDQKVVYVRALQGWVANLAQTKSQ